MEILTSSQKQRILSAIKDCDRFIQKESPRDPSLRSADVQKMLEFYISHKNTLLLKLQSSN